MHRCDRPAIPQRGPHACTCGRTWIPVPGRGTAVTWAPVRRLPTDRLRQIMGGLR